MTFVVSVLVNPSIDLNVLPRLDDAEPGSDAWGVPVTRLLVSAGPCIRMSMLSVMYLRVQSEARTY